MRSVALLCWICWVFEIGRYSKPVLVSLEEVMRPAARRSRGVTVVGQCSVGSTHLAPEDRSRRYQVAIVLVGACGGGDCDREMAGRDHHGG